jgi:hypothetical protein
MSKIIKTPYCVNIITQIFGLDGFLKTGYSAKNKPLILKINLLIKMFP